MCPIIIFRVYKMVSSCSFQNIRVNFFVVLYSYTNFMNWKTIHKERAFNSGNINFWISNKFIQTKNTKAILWFTTCMNYRDSSLQQQTSWWVFVMWILSRYVMLSWLCRSIGSQCFTLNIIWILWWKYIFLMLKALYQV